MKKLVCVLRNETEVTGRRSVDAADNNETHGRINDRLEPGLLRRNVASILEQVGIDVEWVAQVILPPPLQPTTRRLAAPPVDRVPFNETATVVKRQISVDVTL